MTGRKKKEDLFQNICFFLLPFFFLLAVSLSLSLVIWLKSQIAFAKKLSLCKA